MISSTTLLYLDTTLCFVYSIGLMFYSDKITNYYLSIPHSEGMEYINQFWGATLFSISFALYNVIQMEKQRGINLALKMRSLSWLLCTYFHWCNQDLYKDENKYTSAIVMSFTMFLLHSMNITWDDPDLVTTNDVFSEQEEYEEEPQEKCCKDTGCCTDTLITDQIHKVEKFSQEQMDKYRELEKEMELVD